MAKENIIRVIKEGSARLQIPNTVFFNPVQEFNRDLSVLVLKTYLKYNVWHHRSEEKHVTARGGIKVLDALSASGLRSIRYAKELGESGKIVKKIVANDISKAAVDLINTNIKDNNVEDKVVSSLSDAAMLMHMSSTSFDERFHVIDLDPFGTGAPFFDAAVNSIGEAGLLMVTCTDAAVLCGNSSESCFARYGSMSLRADFCHEQALRIILKSLESHATVYGRYIKPLLSISVDFYFRLFVQVFTQQAETKKSASKLSQVYLCKQCKTAELNPLGSYQIKDDPKQSASENLAVKYQFKPSEVNMGDRCRICDGKYTLGGPIWNDSLHDNEFLGLLKKELESAETQKDFGTYRRIQGMVHMCSEEVDVPLFHSIDGISSILRMKMPRTKEIFSALINANYKVSATHTNKTGFKTDAPSKVVWDIFCQIAEKQQGNSKDRSDPDSPSTRILSRKRDKVNPTKGWGPKPRPSASTLDNTYDTISAQEIETGDENKNTKPDDGVPKKQKLL